MRWKGILTVRTVLTPAASWTFHSTFFVTLHSVCATCFHLSTNSKFCAFEAPGSSSDKFGWSALYCTCSLILISQLVEEWGEYLSGKCIWPWNLSLLFCCCWTASRDAVLRTRRMELDYGHTNSNQTRLVLDALLARGDKSSGIHHPSTCNNIQIQ